MQHSKKAHNEFEQWCKDNEIAPEDAFEHKINTATAMEVILIASLIVMAGSVCIMALT